MAEGELLDWELVHGSDTESTDSITSEKKSGSGSSVIDDGMMILSDHFSAGKLETLSDQSLDSTRVDHGSESLSRVELGFDESGDGSVRSELGFYDSKIGTFGDGEVKVSDFEAVDREAVSESTDGAVVTHCEDGHLLESDHEEVGDGRGPVGEVVEREAVSESIDGTVVTHCEDGHLFESEDVEGGDGRGLVEEVVEREAVSESTDGTVVTHCEDGSGDVEVGDGRRQSGVEEPIEDLSYLCSDSGGNELVCGDSGVVNGEDDDVGESEAVEESGGNSVNVVAVDSSVVRSGDESKSRETVWWKMPFVLVKYYAFRIGPVWSVSMAAALMGFVLLGRRLYNMKKKAQRFHLKVAIDEKKVSRVMSQAARLNEAFTEVRRVPVIRPALPSPGAWPVLSLR